MSLRRLSLILAALLPACREPAAPDARLVTQWISATRGLARAEELSAPVAARVTAYSSIALYEAYAADPRSNLRSLAGQVNGLWSVPLTSRARSIDGATVAAEAERVVLDSLLSAGDPRTRLVIDSLALDQITRRRAAGVGSDLSERSVVHGRALGRTLLGWAETDGFLATRGRSWTSAPSNGRWGIVPADPRGASPRGAESGVILAGSVASSRIRARDVRSTLPRFSSTQPTEPDWGRLRTFAIRSADECTPPPPPVYAEWRGSEFWKMGKELYDSVASLTPAKREIALFWAGDSDAAGTSGLHWIDMIGQAIGRDKLTADRAVELYVLTATAMADGLIGGWKEKYRSLVIRPVTFVHRSLDSRWQPSIATAPSPDYPSERAILSGAATEVLVRLLGDSLAFTDSVQGVAGIRARSFRSFAHARDEAAAAAIYGGIHFVPAVVQGLAQGQCVASRVLGRLRTRWTS